MAEDEPWYALRARNPHAPALLRGLAAKVRVTDPEEATRLDKLAADMGAWHSLNPRVK